MKAVRFRRFGGPEVLEVREAGIAVGDFGTSLAWYRKLLGAAECGVEPAKQETYANGVRKVTHLDPDGSEIAFGEVPR